MGTVKYLDKYEMVSDINLRFPGKYEFIHPLNFNGDMYLKTAIRFSNCTHEEYLCPAGLQRGINCKICEDIPVKRGRPKVVNEIPEIIWGTVYYIKIEGTEFYKIGVSKNSVTHRLKKRILLIFEIPCKSKKEAFGIERLILTIYDSKRIVRHFDNAKDLFPLGSGYTETFIEDVLGKNFDLNRFVKRIKKGLFLYENSEG